MLKRSTLRVFSLRSMSVRGSAKDEVLCDSSSFTSGGAAITLNNPRKLNALNQGMVEDVYYYLHHILKEGQATNVVVRNDPSCSAFCAGGDVAAIVQSARSGGSLHKTFFRYEYCLNYLTSVYPLPYVALLNGVTMGGGVGLSVHGRFRVATENTLFAMPETAIGLFPDVGGGYFLPRLQGNLGMFLALTGHRLRAYDLVHAGIATHYVTSDLLRSLEKDLRGISGTFDRAKKVQTVLDNYQQKSFKKPPEFSLDPQLDTINKTFDCETVEHIFSNLKSEGSEWSQKQLKKMSGFSPRSLKITHRQLKVGSMLDLAGCLNVEYRLSQRCCEDNDFIEGVRALLIDKDNSPKWKPNRLEDVDDKIIDHFFSPLPDDEELDVELEKLDHVLSRN